MPVPRPFTLARRIEGGEVFPDRNAVTKALIPIVNAELMALVAVGVDFVQLRLRGADMETVDLVVASHKHSDRLDPETLTGLLCWRRRPTRAACCRKA